ncbi:MAG: hypothetical protein Q8S29_05710 [Phreatobacter sp.]|nr:hypothetical protein [Phreatobacter sp.]
MVTILHAGRREPADHVQLLSIVASHCSLKGICPAHVTTGGIARGATLFMIIGRRTGQTTQN